MHARTVALGIAALLPPGAAAAPPSIHGLGVWPARTVLVGSAPQVVHVRNGGGRPVTIDLSLAGFALDPVGSPRVVARRDPARWLSIRPRVLRLPAGSTRTFTVWPAVPRGARPGDHPALVLLRSRPVGRTIGVRVRIGVVVDVRVPGRVHRRLVLRSLRVVRRGRARRLVLAVANVGDLTETTAAVTLELWARRRLVARLRPRPRELLPRSHGLFQFSYGGRRRGPLRAVVTWRLRPPPAAPAARRVFPLRL